jgi:hypothetical protein
MQIVGRPTIANTAITLADTEYSYDIPAGTKRFEIKLRALNALLKLAFISGASGTTYITIPYGGSYVENDVKAGPITLYFQSPSATQVAEIKTWK